MIRKLCGELGFPCAAVANVGVDVRLLPDTELCFRNAEDDHDSLIGFAGTPSHTHGSFCFTDGRGYSEELDYLDVLVALEKGYVLTCELRQQGKSKIGG